MFTLIQKEVIKLLPGVRYFFKYLLVTKILRYQQFKVCTCIYTHHGEFELSTLIYLLTHIVRLYLINLHFNTSCKVILHMDVSGLPCQE